MAHPYKQFIATGGENNVGDGEGFSASLAASNGISKPVSRKIHLSPIEEHYLKKLLLKNEIARELNSLSPEYNDTSGLRRFGPPFVPADPQRMLENPNDGTLDQIYAISEASIDIFRDQFPLLRFIFDNFIITFPFIKIHLHKLGNTLKEQSKFWLKIQVLFEIFKSKRISNSNDRGSTSKRKLVLYKFQSLFLTLFNSSIYCVQDPEYFEMDKQRRGAYTKLGKFIDASESEQLKQNEQQADTSSLKSDSILLDVNLPHDKLLAYLDDVHDDEFINGWYINVCGVTVERETKSTFWGAKESKYYAFIIFVKNVDTERGWFIKRRYSEFSKLHNNLHVNHPGVKVPELPAKDKNSVRMSGADTEDDEGVIPTMVVTDDMDFTEGMDKETLDALLGSGMSSPISSEEGVLETKGLNLNLNLNVMKSPKLFGKANFMGKTSSASSITSTSDSSSSMGNNSKSKLKSKSSKSFLSTLKKPWSSPSTSQSLSPPPPTSPLALSSSSSSSVLKSPVHRRVGSFASAQTDYSTAETTETAETASSVTFHSASAYVDVNIHADATLDANANGNANVDEVRSFPREPLRQSLRGWLKYVLHVKVLASSVELTAFLKGTDTDVVLSDKEWTDVQRRLYLDHMRLVQHYKFQAALAGIVTTLEHDVEALKKQVYQEGFGYVFDRVKKYATLRDLCGFDESGGGGWLQSAIEDNENAKANTDAGACAGAVDDEKAPLRGLIRIILLEIASTQYELLIGSDSAAATLHTLKRLHAMFPYTLVAGVLRFTNPLAMAKRMIDVFTYQMPSASGAVGVVSEGIGGVMQGLGWIKRKEDGDAYNKNGHNHAAGRGKSLLQLIFSSMLGDDLRKIEREVIEVTKLLRECDESDGSAIISRLDAYFAADDDVVMRVKRVSVKMSVEIPVAVMLPGNGLQGEEVPELSDERLLKGVDKSEELHKLMKRYFHLQLRKYDKESLMSLWNEPELLAVIKEVISMFLSPLIELFKRAEVYRYVPIFAKYVGELLTLCETYSEDYGKWGDGGKGQGKSDIVGALVGVAEKYQEYAYTFIRDMYMGDEEGMLFEGVVEWLNGVVRVLRTSRESEGSSAKLDLNALVNDQVSLNEQEKVELLRSVAAVVKRAERKREALEAMERSGELAQRRQEQEKEKDWAKMVRDQRVDAQWTQLHERVFKIGEAVTGETGADIAYGDEDDLSDEDEEQGSDTRNASAAAVVAQWASLRNDPDAISDDVTTSGTSLPGISASLASAFSVAAGTAVRQ